MRDLIARDERGAVAVLVAILLGGGVLLGMGALVVDVGQLYQERAELQNGADAAAVGVAKSCALGACDPAAAVTYADGNASALTGGTAGVSLVCGSGTLGGCPASTGAMTDCPPPPAGANFVDVSTSTRTASGSTLLPPVFARTVLGNGSYRGTTVRACAQAEWGAPSAATTVESAKNDFLSTGSSPQHGANYRSIVAKLEGQGGSARPQKALQAVAGGHSGLLTSSAARLRHHPFP